MNTQIQTVLWFAIPVTVAISWGIVNEAHASIDPMAHEVVMQTWYGKVPQAKRMHYCDTQSAKSIVKKYNKKATPAGKRELVKAYKYYILNNC